MQEAGVSTTDSAVLACVAAAASAGAIALSHSAREPARRWDGAQGDVEFAEACDSALPQRYDPEELAAFWEKVRFGNMYGAGSLAAHVH